MQYVLLHMLLHLHLRHLSLILPQAPPGSVASPDGVFEVTADYVAQKSLRMASQPMVWLMQRLRVVGQLRLDDKSAFQVLHASCCAMQYHEHRAKSIVANVEFCPMPF